MKTWLSWWSKSDSIDSTRRGQHNKISYKLLVDQTEPHLPLYDVNKGNMTASHRIDEDVTSHAIENGSSLDEQYSHVSRKRKMYMRF